MANENETVEQVCEKIASVAKEMHESDYGEVWSMAYEIERCNDEIFAAHKREIAAKDDEIASLRALVKELADALETKTDAERDCNGICRACRRFINIRECDVSTNTALVAKAREVCHV